MFASVTSRLTASFITKGQTNRSFRNGSNHATASHHVLGEFGFENFDYDTIEEARKGFERLKKDCTKAYKKDGIERRLLMVIEDWETKA